MSVSINSVPAMHTVSATLTRGTSGGKVVYNGYSSGLYGSLSMVFKGATITTWATIGTTLIITLNNSALPKGFFQKVVSTAGTLYAQNSSYSAGSWTWTGVTGLSSSGTETITMTG